MFDIKKGIVIFGLVSQIFVECKDCCNSCKGGNSNSNSNSNSNNNNNVKNEVTIDDLKPIFGEYVCDGTINNIVNALNDGMYNHNSIQVVSPVKKAGEEILMIEKGCVRKVAKLPSDDELENIDLTTFFVEFAFDSDKNDITKVGFRFGKKPVPTTFENLKWSSLYNCVQDDAIRRIADFIKNGKDFCLNKDNLKVLNDSIKNMSYGKIGKYSAYLIYATSDGKQLISYDSSYSGCIRIDINVSNMNNDLSISVFKV